jgi:hypothetical protein
MTSVRINKLNHGVYGLTVTPWRIINVTKEVTIMIPKIGNMSYIKAAKCFQIGVVDMFSSSK